MIIPEHSILEAELGWLGGGWLLVGVSPLIIGVLQSQERVNQGPPLTWNKPVWIYQNKISSF